MEVEEGVRCEQLEQLLADLSVAPFACASEVECWTEVLFGRSHPSSVYIRACTSVQHHTAEYASRRLAFCRISRRRVDRQSPHVRQRERTRAGHLDRWVAHRQEHRSVLVASERPLAPVSIIASDHDRSAWKSRLRHRRRCRVLERVPHRRPPSAHREGRSRPPCCSSGGRPAHPPHMVQHEE